MNTHVEQTHQERILKVLIYIQNHLDSELSLEELASIAFFSPFHFHRIFTSHTGESVKSYVRRLRLDRAARDLAFTDLTLTQIAERAGYDTQQSFHRAFKDAHKETPKAYRTLSQEKMRLHPENQHFLPSVSVKKIDPIKVAFVRHVGPYEEALPAWHTLAASIGIQNLLSTNTLKISIAHDSPETTSKDKLRYDACASLTQANEFKPHGTTGIQTLHGGKYAVIQHRGPLETISKTYHHLFGLWLPKSGYEPADHPNFILHVNSPIETPTEELISDIYLPIQ